MTFEQLPVTVMIMTQNESENIKFALNSVYKYFSQVIVTDSYSSDNTKLICKSFEEVEFYENKFVGWAEQRNWMLQNCDIKNEIVFFLDADEWIDESFVEELRDVLENNIEFTAIYLRVKFIFLGKWIKYSYGHPTIKRIFKKKNLFFTGEGAREYANIDETIVHTMSNYLIHEDRKAFSFWIEKHIKNAKREAAHYIQKENCKKVIDAKNMGVRLRLKLWIRKNVWNKIGIGIRPVFYFVYRYFIQLGLLDGLVGFIFCVNHALWYQMLIDINILEEKRK